MIRVIHSAAVQDGKEEEARQWVQDYQAYDSTHFPSSHAQGFIEQFSHMGRLYAMYDAADLATYERESAHKATDPECQALDRRALGLLVAGTYRVVVLQFL